jgi:membrane associated rhomboid family serine protease
MDPLSLLIIAIIAATLVLGALKRFDLAATLVLGNLAIFFVSLFASKSILYADLAFQPADLQSGTDLYTIFTSMFVHDNFAHVIGNMLFLYFLGTPLESRIGKLRFAVVYFSAGIAGALVAAVVVLGLGSNPYVYMVGASGAISGAVGALLVLYPRDEFPMFLGPIFLPKVPVWLSALGWLFFSVFLAIIISSHVSWEAHVGGFMAGLVVGLLIGRRVEEQRRKDEAPVDYSKLEPLATTPQLRNALENIKTETHKDVRKAWLEYFAEHAQCPKCGGKMKFRRDRFICQCGEEVEIR